MPKIHIGRTLISARINWNGLKRLEQQEMGRNSTKGGTRDLHSGIHTSTRFSNRNGIYILLKVET